MGMQSSCDRELCAVHRPHTYQQVEDAVKAAAIFNLLMGEKVEPRREYIERNAFKAVNLDY